eukprot:jgi/Chrzof1/11022/Cz05g20210.t1
MNSLGYSGKHMQLSGHQYATRRQLLGPCKGVHTSTAAPPRQHASQSSNTQSMQRAERLQTLVELKKLYRNCLRAENLLQQPSPVWQQPDRLGDTLHDDTPVVLASQDDEEDEYQERLRVAVDMVAEMQLTAEQLKLGLRSLFPGFGCVFAEPQADTHIRAVAQELSIKLKERAAWELPQLPFASERDAQAALDLRNSRYNRRLQALMEAEQAAAAAASMSGSGSISVGSPIERFNQAERVAEKFVAKRIKPALQRAQERRFLEVVAESGKYLRGLWDRLNGSGDRAGSGLVPAQLPLPVSTKKDVERIITELGMELETLERQLQEASKARETKLRKAGIAGRVALATQLKMLDADVITLSRLLAVRTLQLEMEYVYKSIEDEALDIAPDELVEQGPLAREGSTGELALLVAEYGLLEEQLLVLADALQCEDGTGSLCLLDDDVLEVLAAEIPDLRLRVGVPDTVVFGSNPFSPTKLKLQAKESIGKVGEGINFLLRGLRLLGSDTSNAGRLFTKAALGGTLKPREVAAIRRTLRDLLTFIPFIIILIIPLSPLGHVLVFGFIQRYFPGFFPTQFTSKRQEIMMRYEELQHELAEAQENAEQEEEEAELRRAAAAVARLTAPDSRRLALASADGSSSSMDGAAAAKVKLLEEQVMEARENVHAGLEGEGEEDKGVNKKKNKQR